MSYVRPFMQKLCRVSFCVSLFTLSSVSFNATLNAESRHHHKSDALELGIALETRFWNLVENHNVEKFSAKLAHIFQGLNVSGVYTIEEQINGLAQANLVSFEINNPKSHRFSDILVFSYDFVASGTGLTSGPSITVWKKDDNYWKIISHSYVPFVK